MRLGKPPVIELWIEFQYALTEDAQEWTLDRARTLINDCFGEKFAIEAYRSRTDFRISDANIEGEAQVQTQITIDRIRATTKEKDRYIQAGKDILVFHVIRTEKEWPYFAKIKPEAIESAEKYGSFMKLSNLESVSLHYRDDIKLPLGEQNMIKLQDYITIFPETPEEEWAIPSDFSISLTLPKLCESTISQLVVETEPAFIEESETGKKYRRLKMDWHATSNISLNNSSEVEKWLEKAHFDLINAFKNVFTEKGLNLFEPLEN